MWTCSKCGEAIDDSFDSCWKCADESQTSTPVGGRHWPFIPILLGFLASVLSYVIFGPAFETKREEFGLKLYAGGVVLYFSRWIVARVRNEQNVDYWIYIILLNLLPILISWIAELAIRFAVP